MEVTHDLCQAVQQKPQDIIIAIHLVSSTKILIQRLREDGWDLLFEKVKPFCHKHGIDVLDMGVSYTLGHGRSHLQKDPIIMEHHFRVDIFYTIIDSQLQELNEKFKEDMVELLVLCSALESTDDYKSFNIYNICKLAEKFYPEDFSEQEKLHLRHQLEHFELDIRWHSALQNLSSIFELCQGLMKTGKSNIYLLVDKLVLLVLTVPISTATTEHAFSAMKISKSLYKTPTAYDIFYKTHINKEGKCVDSRAHAVYDIMQKMVGTTSELLSNGS
ncbi:uncharacterized protein LOC120282745 [Dioscorea cayenensis subsp. rotundata]|uniref:Uncharacterized protein LOC120282745 n=1 Tax=Dioscorea cayennensis subsp. rotundata TaxID=55577 RepID=A0AB40D361_DIOCR|nr:uncharacterized protein LOC120282745 [Dioscorea cayenensis subsp. rotundata]